MVTHTPPGAPPGGPPSDPPETREPHDERAPRRERAPRPERTPPGPLVQGQSADARRVRELLRKGGLGLRAAARELEIDELALRGYCTGRPVPRYVMLAIERLADLRRTHVYYLARAADAPEILTHGFRDGSGGTRLATPLHRGVWVSDRLLVLLSNIELEDIACFEIRVSEPWLTRYEWSEAGKGYREFLVPAAELNDFPRRRLPDKEWRSMPWAH
jgi:hypothetical protein